MLGSLLVDVKARTCTGTEPNRARKAGCTKADRNVFMDTRHMCMEDRCMFVCFANAGKLCEAKVNERRLVVLTATYNHSIKFLEPCIRWRPRQSRHFECFAK